MRLTELPKKSLAKIISISGDDMILLERLKNFGFEKQQTVEVLNSGFLGKGPFAVRLDNHVVAIGKAEADLILIAQL